MKTRTLIIAAALTLAALPAQGQAPADSLQAQADTLAVVAPAQSLAALDALQIEAETRCAPYDRGDYSYSQSLEPKIVEYHGFGQCSPYDGRCFETLTGSEGSDIEHIVGIAEAHDSGLCARPADRKEFASDIDNLTLATPRLNRYGKGGKDAGEWLPDQNRCWFAARVVAVKGKWNLSVDQTEYEALRGVLAGCEE